MSQTWVRRWARWLLLAIVVLYVVLGTLYAACTPAWQAPDEPAHYNYVRSLAERGRFPVLKPGDYPAAYLEEIKAAHFPPEMSIDPIRYEFHQPPLYYLLAVPVYRLFGGALLPLRLLSVVMGALLLLVVYWTVAALAAERLFLALGVTAFVAFLPMHLAMTAAVNNDTLAELLLATILLLMMRYLQSPGGGRLRLLVLLGVATGLGLVTKSSVYVALPLVVVALAAREVGLERATLVGVLRAAGSYLVPALALGLPWWLRNMAIYGGFDLLGLARHERVVVGQLRTADFLAQRGWGELARAFGATSFRSFWGQFGWMGVLLDERLYQALAILSALAVVGFSYWLAGVWRRRPALPAWQRTACGLLVLSGLLTLASYVWYNTQFVQHQGRYLFPALVPIGLAAALGWRQALERERALPLALAMLLVAVITWVGGWMPTWPFLMLVAMVVALGVRRALPPRWDGLVQACPYLLLMVLDVASLFLFIVPQLRV
jgi:4-amino-4-deoxy-L-arabinose transferase-like glycosyltransferase